MLYMRRSESTNIFGANDVICRAVWRHLSFLTYQLSIFDDVEVDSPDHVTCKWLPTRKVCSCMMLSNWRVWLQMIFCSCKNETMLFSSLGSLMRENGRSLCFPKRFFKIKKQTQWSNVSCRSVSGRSIIFVLPTETSGYFSITKFNNNC